MISLKKFLNKPLNNIKSNIFYFLVNKSLVKNGFKWLRFINRFTKINFYHYYHEFWINKNYLVLFIKKII